MSLFSCQGSCLLLGVGCCGDRRELSNEKIVGDMSSALGLMHAEFVNTQYYELGWRCHIVVFPDVSGSSYSVLGACWIIGCLSLRGFYYNPGMLIIFSVGTSRSAQEGRLESTVEKEVRFDHERPKYQAREF